MFIALGIYNLPVDMVLNGLGGGAGEDGSEDSICWFPPASSCPFE